MGPALILIVRRVVAPLGEHLPGKAVPAAVEQRLLFRLRQAGKACQIPGVVGQQRRVIEHTGRDEHPRPLHLLVGAVRQAYRDGFHNGCAGRGGGDEPRLHPAVADAAGVRCGTHIHPGARPGGAVTAHHVAVLVPLKVGQLVKADKIVGLALIVGAVLGVLHGAEPDLCPAGKDPYMRGSVVLRLRESPAVVHLALIHKVGKLWVGLAQDQRPVMRDMHLPQRFDEQCIALAAARRAAVQRLRLRSAHKFQLPGLRLPHNDCPLGSVHSFSSCSTGGSSTTPHSVPSSSVP